MTFQPTNLTLIVAFLAGLALGGGMRGCDGMPIPDITPTPAPLSVTGVLFIEETESPRQPASFASVEVRKYLADRGIPFRQWDQHMPPEAMARGPEGFVDAMSKAKSADGFQPPWVVISNADAQRGFNGPAPTDPGEMLSLLKRYMD